MDKDEIKGKLEQAKGHVKEKVGEVTDNEHLEAEGAAEQAEGSMREKAGEVKDETRKALDD